MYEDIAPAAQEDPEWVAWLSQVDTAVDRLFGETLPSVPADWETLSDKAVGPMPQVDRYSNEMSLYWITDVLDFFFPDEEALYEHERADIVNQFVCYIGEYFVRHCGGEWVNDPEARVFHTFGPTICYDWTTDADYPINMLFKAVESANFMHVTSEWYTRSTDYAEAHDLPHDGRELRRKHGQRG